MQRFFELTKENLDKIIMFVNKPEQKLIEESVATAFQTLFFAFQRKLMKNMITQTYENQRLMKRIARIDLKKNQTIEENEFSCTELDSLDIANALLYQMQQMGNHKYTKTKVILILYEVYCQCLSDKKERLCLEHPVATQWGP